MGSPSWTTWSPSALRALSASSTQITAKNSSSETRTGRSRSVLTRRQRACGTWPRRSRLVLHPDGQRGAHRVLNARVLEHCLGAGLVVGDEHDSAAFPAHRRAQYEVDTGAGHRLAQPGKLAGLVLQVHGEHAHLVPLSPRQWRGSPLTPNVPRRSRRKRRSRLGSTLATKPAPLILNLTAAIARSACRTAVSSA